MMSQIRVCNQKIIRFFSTKTYVEGTQKNRLDETILLSTQNMCLKLENFTHKRFAYLELCDQLSLS